MVSCVLNGPGGCHDNDYSDYHEIAILPTADEILLKSIKLSLSWIWINPLTKSLILLASTTLPSVEFTLNFILTWLNPLVAVLSS